MPLPWHGDLALATLVWFSLAATAKQVKMSFKMSSQHFDVVRVRVLQSTEQLLKPLPNVGQQLQIQIQHKHQHWHQSYNYNYNLSFVCV